MKMESAATLELHANEMLEDAFTEAALVLQQRAQDAHDELVDVQSLHPEALGLQISFEGR